MLGLGLSINRSVCAGKPPEPDYQQWDAFPDSPVTTADFPYQVVLTKDPWTLLFVATTPMWVADNVIRSATTVRLYDTKANTWADEGASGGWEIIGRVAQEANNDVYDSSSFTTVYFAKTT